jgi:hypothetical protein
VESVSNSDVAQATDERGKAAQAPKKETENQRRRRIWNARNRDRARCMLIMRGMCDKERNAAIADQTHPHEGLWSLFWTSVIARRICVARHSCFRMRQSHAHF